MVSTWIAQTLMGSVPDALKLPVSTLHSHPTAGACLGLTEAVSHLAVHAVSCQATHPRTLGTTLLEQVLGLFFYCSK